MKKRIAIIGAGIGGTSILRRLVEHEKFNTEYSVDIYDKEALLGRGFAFKHDSKHLLINTITKE
ncbi:FAD/NAD(P)-binding protein, partial [Phocicoccus schoeneichii]